MQLKNEMKYEEMIDIMMELHKYVPVEQSSTTVMVNGTEHIVEREKSYPICFGGDQLSAARY